MADTQNPTPTDANAVLVRQVAVPTYFRKLAAEGGYVPPDDADARRVLRLGDAVKRAVDEFLDSREKSAQQSAGAAVKYAADVAFDIAGVPQDRPAAADLSDFLSDDLVKAAASLFVDEEVKLAMNAEPTPPAPDATPAAA